MGDRERSVRRRADSQKEIFREIERERERQSSPLSFSLSLSFYPHAAIFGVLAGPRADFGTGTSGGSGCGSGLGDGASPEAWMLQAPPRKPRRILPKRENQQNDKKDKSEERKRERTYRNMNKQ